MLSLQHEWRTKKVLVTGGAGFIGSHVVSQLVMNGADVTILDLRHPDEHLEALSDHVTVHVYDMCQLSWEHWLKEQSFDVIFHLAANAYVPPSVERPAGDYEINLAVTFHLLEALRQLQWPGKLIYASSAAVYGNACRIPICEDDPTVPISPYGVSKLAAERYVAVYSQLYGMHAASLRCFSVYGPRQRKQVVYDLIQKLVLNPHEMLIYGDGSQVRDFGYVADVAHAALIVAERGALHGETYNVASGYGCTIEHLVELLCQFLHRSPQLIYSGRVRQGDPERWVADIRRLAALGYCPQTSLETGLRETIAWYQKTASNGDS